MGAVKAIFFKELKIEFRNKQMINSTLILSFLILATIRFAFSVVEFELTELASPIIWITFFFSGMFSLAPTYKREVDQGTKDGLMLAPISSSSIFFGKFLSNLLIIMALNMFSMVLFFVFFPVSSPDILALLVIVILGTIGFTALGNIISAISSNLAQSEIMLPVLLVPILIFTVVMTVVSTTSEIFSGASIFDIQEGIKLILAFDIVFLACGYLLIDYILEV